MANNIFETIDSIIKGIVYFCILLVAAVAAVFVLYFIAMTGYRLFWLCWDAIFCHKWEI